MKEKKQIKQSIIIVLLCILLLLTGLCIFLSLRAMEQSKKCCELKVSDSQSDYSDPLAKKEEDGYTELMGFGCLELDRDSPFVYLINPPENQVYLSFDVICDEKTLYKSDLISPGKMESFDAYACLNAGEHTLVYSISSYDMDDKAILWSGVRQNQDILIRK